jgi:predicted dehydrogenase
MRPYRAGLIGCGRIARMHARVLRANPRTELVAVCDRDPETLAVFGQEWEVPAAARFTDPHALLDAVDLDIVHVATYANSHEAIVTAAAARRRHVFCEKPAAMDLDQVDRMIAACDAAGVQLCINHHRRGDSRFRRARDLIANGAIGRLRMLKADHGGGGYSLMERSTHAYDLLRFLAGDVAWVFGQVLAAGREATREDIYEEPRHGLACGDEIALHLAFRSGAYGQHDGLGHVDIEVIGDRGRMLFYEGPPRRPWAFGDVRAVWSPDPLRQPYRPLDGVSPEHLRHPGHAYDRMVEEFLRAIDGGGSVPCSGADGRASIEIVFALYLSHFTERRVALPLATGVNPLAALRTA